MPTYTHKEKAQNLILEFQKKKIIEFTPYAGARTEYSELNDREARECAKIALERNIDNLEIIVNRLNEQGHEGIAELFDALLKDEQSILSEIF